MLMFFTSGTTGYPEDRRRTTTNTRSGHFITANYWHCVDPDGLHLTISDTGWAKALWGKLYGQWLCEAAVFVYDFDRFDAADILPMFAKYHITTFCAPPTMYRMMIKEDLSKYDMSSIQHATIAGEALNPEVFRQLEKLTGLQVMEGFGQSETTLVIGNLFGGKHKIGSMGKPVPLYDVDLVDSDGKSVPDGEPGQICHPHRPRTPLRTVHGVLSRRGKDGGVQPRRYGTIPETWRGATRTASSGMSAVRTTSSNPPGTASGRSRSRTSSWNCPTFWNAASPPHPTRCAARSSRRASS